MVWNAGGGESPFGRGEAPQGIARQKKELRAGLLLSPKGKVETLRKINAIFEGPESAGFRNNWSGIPNLSMCAWVPALPASQRALGRQSVTAPLY
jgi:hypothetical protein